MSTPLEMGEIPKAAERGRVPSLSVQANEATPDLKVQIGWENLKLVVKDRADGSDKTILHGLTGSVRWGEMMMVIGPSGSGKTSFLNCIADLAVGDVTGKLRFNGRARPKNFKRFTGVVPQDDVFFSSLTVRESLTFAAALKLSKPREARLERVEEIIDELDLTRCADTTIGEIGHGISGGERRRLSIGLELIHEPAVLLLDEPTTGLDSASALLIGKIIRRLVDTRGVTVIATIHQPRLGLAQMFDKLYFLASGKEMYLGSVDPDLLPFLKSAGYTPPKLENPLDYVLDLVNTSEVDENERQSRESVLEKLNAFYLSSSFAKEARNQEIPDDANTDAFFEEIERLPMYITPFYFQFLVIAHRSFLYKLREPSAFVTQLFNATLMNVIFGSIYYQIDLSFQSQLDRVKAISITMMMMTFGAVDILLLFPIERDLLNRENDAGLYSTLSYFLGRSVAEAPVHTLSGWIGASITYGMFGMQAGANHYWIWAAACVLLMNAGASALMFFSAISSDLEQSNMFATFLIIFMLFDGNWISLDKIPVYYKWLRSINFIAYATHSAIANEYRGLTFKCTASDVEKRVCLPGQIETGRQFLGKRGLENVNIRFNFIMLGVLFVAFRILAFIALVFCHRTHPPDVMVMCGCREKLNVEHSDRLLADV